MPTGLKDITNSDAIIYTIKLPLIDNISQLDLNVKKNKFILTSKEYKLKVYYNESINEPLVKAQWIKKDKILKLTLPYL